MVVIKKYYLFFIFVLSIQSNMISVTQPKDLGFLKKYNMYMIIIFKFRKVGSYNYIRNVFEKKIPVTFGYFIAWKYISTVFLLTSGNACIFRTTMKFIVYASQPRMGICAVKDGGRKISLKKSKCVYHKNVNIQI